MVRRILAPATSTTTSWPTSATNRSSPHRWTPFGERKPVTHLADTSLPADDTLLR